MHVPIRRRHAGVARVIGDLDAVADRPGEPAGEDAPELLAALRRRRRGESAPPAGMPWGYGRYVDQISRNWARPHFGIRRMLPWLGEIRELHDVGSTRRLDLAIARVAWHGLAQAQQEHEFDFDAVVLYVLKYDMIARRLGYSAAKARERFDELVATGLGEYAALATEPVMDRR